MVYGVSNQATVVRFPEEGREFPLSRLRIRHYTSTYAFKLCTRKFDIFIHVIRVKNKERVENSQA
jgi:hypothetical protein